MVLAFHIIIAILSVVFTFNLYLRPSLSKLRISYALIALTTISGTYLIVTMRGNILLTCLFGLSFVTLLLGGTLLAKKKLVREEAKA